MSISLRKLAARLIAAVMTVSAVTAANAAALEQPVAVLSSSLNASVGTVLTSDEVTTAAKAYSRAKADAEAQARAAAAAKAAADARGTDELCHKFRLLRFQLRKFVGNNEQML